MTTWEQWDSLMRDVDDAKTKERDALIDEIVKTSEEIGRITEWLDNYEQGPLSAVVTDIKVQRERQADAIERLKQWTR